MDDDKLAFLSEGAPAPEAQAEAPQAAPAAPTPPETPPRGSDGRFAAREGQPAPTPTSTPVPAAETPAPASQPPLTEKETVGFYRAMQEEREKRQAAERRVAELQARQSPPPAPTREDQIQAELYGQRLDMSRGFADSKYGAETMAKVHDWAHARCDADPAFNQQVLRSKNPYEFVKDAYDREQVLAAVKPSDLDDFNAWRAAQAAGGSPQPTPTPTPQPAPPPRSLITAPNAGGGGKTEIPMGPGAAFASTIR